MISTSQEYRDEVVKSARKTDAVISFGVFDISAREDGTASATSSKPFTDPQQVLDGLEEPGFKMATFEPDFFRMDGNFSLVPDDVNTDDNLGWWSNERSGEDRYLPAPVELVLTFSLLHSSIGIGVMFGDSICSDFDITWYRDDGILEFVSIEGNTKKRFYTPNAVEDYNKVVLRFFKTDKPHRHVRVAEITFGVEEIFNSDNIIAARIIEEVDPSGAVLSINKLRFTVSNENQRFNMLNPDGIYVFLQRRQPIRAQSGLLLPNGEYEYVDMGTFYLSDWKNASGLTATLDATDAIGLLDKTMYYKSLFWVDAAFETVLQHILNDAGAFRYEIAPELATETVTGYIPIVSHREALQLLFMAARGIIRIDREGGIQGYRPSYNEAQATLDYDTIIGDPTIEQKPMITIVEATEYGYSLGTELENLHESTLSLDGQHTLTIPYSKAAYDVTLSISGSGSVVGGPEYSATSVTVTINCTGVVTITVTGKPYIESTRIVRASVPLLHAGEVPQTAVISDNKLLFHEKAQAAAEHVLSYYQKRIKQRLDFWGNPAIQAGDVLNIQTMFGVSKSGILERQDIKLSPSISTRLEVTG